MQELKKDEMQSIKGGGISIWIVTGISVAIVFISGIIDGFVRPQECQSKK